jgi:hypothetical protein
MELKFSLMLSAGHSPTLQAAGFLREVGDTTNAGRRPQLFYGVTISGQATPVDRLPFRKASGVFAQQQRPKGYRPGWKGG